MNYAGDNFKLALLRQELIEQFIADKRQQLILSKVQRKINDQERQCLSKKKKKMGKPLPPNFIDVVFVSSCLGQDSERSQTEGRQGKEE
jgi:hypothetical protein